MTFEAILAIVRSVSYKPGWLLDLRRESDSNRYYVQVRLTEEADAARCAVTGERLPWKGGKRYLSKHMCRQEIVGACFGAIEDAEKHEMREWFKYRGVAIYDPHLDPDALVTFASNPAHRSVRD